MSEDELKEIKSYCWHDGKPITNVVFKTSRSGDKWDVTWSDEHGDPSLYGYKLVDVIDNIGDGDWNSGLYKRK